MKESKYYIYQHILPNSTKPFYIGVGKEGTDRINHKRRNAIWKDIVKKNNNIYNKEKLVYNLTLQEADEIEILLITFWGRIKYNTGCLANILKGGHDNKDYHKITPEEKEQLRLKMIGNKFAKGLPWTEERRQKHIQQRTGKPSGKAGKTTSDETKAKQSESHKGNKSHTGKIFINNGVEGKIVPKDSIIPEGWWKGRLITWKITGRPKKNNNQINNLN